MERGCSAAGESYDAAAGSVGAVGAAAAFNVLLNLVLIPRFGIVGAAVATVMAEALLLLLGLVAVYKIGARLPLRPLLRPLLAGTVMGAGLIILGPDRALAIYLPAGFFTYVLALLLFRGLPRDARPHLSSLASSAHEIYKKLGRG